MRERGVMHLVAQGLSNKDVARHLHVSEGTVKLHLHHVFCKTGVRRRAALAATLAGRIEAQRAERALEGRQPTQILQIGNLAAGRITLNGDPTVGAAQSRRHHRGHGIGFFGDRSSQSHE